MFDIVYLKTYLIIFMTSLIAGFILTPIIRKLALKFKIMDYPTHRKIHTEPKPRLGGIAIFISYALGAIMCKIVSPELYQFNGLLKGGVIILFIGAWDDIRPVNAVIKLLALFGATFLLSKYGIMATLFNNYYLDLLITLFWIVGVTSAFNAIDNMDGLAIGIAFIAAFFYFLVGVQTGQASWAALSCVLMGASLAFLKYNRYPASIFMGDSGSFFLGFTLASLGLMGGWSTNPVKASIVPILILGVPLFDLCYTVARRHFEGVTKSLKEIITFSGKDHLSHRLVDLGMSFQAAVCFIYLISICLAVGAVVLRNISKVEAILLLGQFLVVLFIVITLMNLLWKKIKQ